MACDLADDVPAVLSEALLRRFDTPGPRYTSYPTADRFHDGFTPTMVEETLRERAATGRALGPLSVYVHIPFCESVCYYCACNKVVTRHHERAGEYLDALDTEIALVARSLGSEQRVSQLHFGGGTPTWATTRLCALTSRAGSTETTFPRPATRRAWQRIAPSQSRRSLGPARSGHVLRRSRLRRRAAVRSDAAPVRHARAALHVVSDG